MRKQELILPVCIAIAIHAGFFVFGPSRAKSIPNYIIEERTIEISLVETPRPEKCIPKKTANVNTQRAERKIERKKSRPPSKSKSTPKPRPQPEPEYTPQPNIVPLPEPVFEEKSPIPDKTIQDIDTATVPQEMPQSFKGTQFNDWEDTDEQTIPATASLQPKEALGDQRSVVADTTPSYVNCPKPSYPTMARKRGIEGIVVLRVEVLANGKVGQIDVKESSGHRMLDTSALKAVKDWVFLPGTREGIITTSWVNIPIRFELGK